MVYTVYILIVNSNKMSNLHLAQIKEVIHDSKEIGWTVIVGVMYSNILDFPNEVSIFYLYLLNGMFTALFYLIF